jgi:hypothetical protein
VAVVPSLESEMRGEDMVGSGTAKKEGSPRREEAKAAGNASEGLSLTSVGRVADDLERGGVDSGKGGGSKREIKSDPLGAADRDEGAGGGKNDSWDAGTRRIVAEGIL